MNRLGDSQFDKPPRIGTEQRKEQHDKHPDVMTHVYVVQRDPNAHDQSHQPRTPTAEQGQQAARQYQGANQHSGVVPRRK